MQEPSSVLIVVELVKVGHAELNLSRKASYNGTLVLLLIRPVACREDFHTELKVKLLIER
jgi:hypothetical protein